MIMGTVIAVVSREVAEYLVVNQGLKLIGRGAKGRKNMKKLSFEEIRNLVAQQGQSVAQTTAQVTHKVAETAKSVTSAIKGVMPVTHNQMDHNMECMLNLVHSQGIALAHVQGQMSQLGFPAPEVNHDMIAQLTRSSMEAIKGKPVAVSQTPQIAVEAQTPAPIAEPAVVVSSASSNPLDMMSGARQDMPSNWFMGPAV
jgi:predicted extracellular nuclease